MPHSDDEIVNERQPEKRDRLGGAFREWIMELFADPITINSPKALAGLELIGADYGLTKVDYFKGKQKGHECKAIVAIAAPMHLHHWQRLPLDDYPNVVKWMTERIETAPWWKSTRVGEGFTLPDAA
jgi:glutathione S-transferase